MDMLLSQACNGFNVEEGHSHSEDVVVLRCVVLPCSLFLAQISLNEWVRIVNLSEVLQNVNELLYFYGPL